MAMLYVVIAFICLIVPLILTLLNIINLFKKKKIKENLIDILTFSLGIILTILLYFICGFEDYNVALRLGGGEIDVHSPIASWSYPTVLAIFLLGIISYGLIRIKKIKATTVSNCRGNVRNFYMFNIYDNFYNTIKQKYSRVSNFRNTIFNNISY